MLRKDLVMPTYQEWVLYSGSPSNTGIYHLVLAAKDGGFFLKAESCPFDDESPVVQEIQINPAHAPLFRMLGNRLDEQSGKRVKHD